MFIKIWKRFSAFLKQPAVRKTGRISLITLKWLSIAGMLTLILVGAAAFGYVSAVLKDEPVRSKEEIMEKVNDNIITGFVHFNDDSLIGQLRSEEDRRLAELREIPQGIIDAVLSIEDNNYYNHHGVDVNGIFRAVKQKVMHEDVQTGGSTITQQLARRVFLTLDRDINRKIKEIALSVRLERVMSKEQILLAYLNKIPYGNGSNGYVVYGIKAAANGIFGKHDLNELNIAQSAYLAGLPQLPSNYSAFTSKGEFDSAAFKRAVGRQQLVLKRMLQENKITERQYEEALQFDLKDSLAQKQLKAYTTYPYLMLEAEKQAAEALLRVQNPNLVLDTESKKEAYNEALKDARNQLLKGGYHIYTTIDKTIYDSMQDIARNPKNFSPDLPNKGKDGLEQIGAVMVNNKTGAILGMIEGRDFSKEQLNHATQAYRQPGSTMKPIAAYIPAMEKGAIQPASVIDDVPVVLPDAQKGVHIPENWNDRYHGLMTARTALNNSYNIPAIKLFLYSVGINEAWDFAKKIGIKSITKEDYTAQTGVIGGLFKGVSVTEMTNAYSTIPNQGVFNQAYMISKIVDSNGKTVYQQEKKPSRAYSEETAYLITDMLRTVISEGTATDLMKKFKYYNKVPVSGKTGSTQDDADAWFIGFSPDITLGVWAGYDQPVNKLSKDTGGTKRAINIWSLVMNETFEKRPELFASKAFERPDNIVQMTVSNVSGKLPNDLTRAAGKLTTDLFNSKYIPTQEDDVMVRMKVISFNGVNYLPQPNTPDDFLNERIAIKREQSISSILKKIQEALQKVPENKRKPISHYVPADADDDAPAETDPRTDDGKIPPAPDKLEMARSGDSYRLSFGSDGTSDIVGYRLYRSPLAVGFQRVPGKVILTGQDTVFHDTPGPGLYSYYVTAVDVAGRESQPSKVVYPDGQLRDLLNLPSNNDGSGESRPIGSQTPSPGSPTAPSGLKADRKGMALHLTWKANPPGDNVQHYNIYYSDKENGSYASMGNSKGTEFIYYALTDQGYYRVTAVNDKGESLPSKPVHFKK